MLLVHVLIFTAIGTKQDIGNVVLYTGPSILRVRLEFFSNKFPKSSAFIRFSRSKVLQNLESRVHYIITSIHLRFFPLWCIRIFRWLVASLLQVLCPRFTRNLKQGFFFQLPSIPDGWLNLAENFNNQWNFPHCVGAIDGKHVVLQAPYRSGSDYYNFKGFFSIVLFAAVDSNYNLIYINCGCQGRISDGGVFNNCNLYTKMQNKSLNLPQPRALPMRNKEIPYYFIGDEAFALSENIMKVYSGHHRKGTKERIYNYRLCRARRVVENVFGIMSAVFRVLRKPMLLQPENATLVVNAIAHLHNFLRRNRRSRDLYTPPGSFDRDNLGVITPGSWRADTEENTGLMDLDEQQEAAQIVPQEIREEISNYCSQEGAVPWQNEYA